jgi:hypothetical protein
MSAELWIFAVVMLFVAFVWVNAARTSGVLEGMTADGFEIRTLLRGRLWIPWNQIARPVHQFDRFLPRVVVHVKSTRLRRVTSAYTVYLRGRTGERDLLEKLDGSVGVTRQDR